MYAIIRTGGKQYRVEEGRSVNVELLKAEEGSSVELKDVLLIANNGDITVGTPVIDGARVLADVEAHAREKKIIVFKFRAKVRTRKKTGHRQHFTRLAVTEILAPGQESKAAKPKRQTRKKTEEKAGAAATTAVAEASATTAAPEKKVAPKRATRKATPAKAKVKTKAKASAAASEKKAPPKRRTRKPTAKAAGDDAGAAKKPARKRTAKKADEDKE